MTEPKRLKFGAFIAPIHAPDENPTYALQRDLDIVRWLDHLGFEEVFFGEHHTTGWEYVSSPEVMIAAAAMQTQSIKLGTGVVTVPLHHPLHVVDRMCQLDHLTRGRVILGTGPGLLMGDHFGVASDGSRARIDWEEGLEAIWRLLNETEPITMKGAKFEMREAMTQLGPYQRPHFPIVVASGASMAGVTLAGRYASGVLTFGASLSNPRVSVAKRLPLSGMWDRVEEVAAANGRSLGRETWRIAVPLHIAPTREQAFDDVREGAARWLIDYLADTTGQPAPDVARDDIVDFMVEEGNWAVGSVDDVCERIDNLLESTQGFGTLLCFNLDWASHHKVKESYELLARHVMPRYSDMTQSLQRAQRWYSENNTHLIETYHQSVARGNEHFGPMKR